MAIRDQRDGSGILFKNERKDKENQPDYKGSITVRGEQFWLSAWIKQGQNGKFMSVAVTPKEQGNFQKPKLAVAGGTDTEIDDEIPF